MPKPSRDTGIRLDVEGDVVSIRGPLRLLRKHIDLSLLNYVESDGEVETTIHDPIPHERRQRANGVLHKMRSLVERPSFMRAGWLSERRMH